MIKLKSPLNYKGTLLEKGAVVGFLTVDLQEKLIKNGAAEKVSSELEEPKKTNEKPVDKMTKAELLELAAKCGISVAEEMTKAEIIKAIEVGNNESQGSDTN